MARVKNNNVKRGVNGVIALAGKKLLPTKRRRLETAVGAKQKKKRRYKPGTLALKEIRKYQGMSKTRKYFTSFYFHFTHYLLHLS